MLRFILLISVGATLSFSSRTKFQGDTTFAAPSTVAPTTAAPTTAAPTTAAPITLAPSTETPTTVAPISIAPTTAAPTTVAPTTVAPTTVAPISAAPSTYMPTTMVPTSAIPTSAPFTATPSLMFTSAPFTSVVENVFHISVAIQFNGVNGNCSVIASNAAVQSQLERINDDQSALPIGSSAYWKCMDGYFLHGTQGRRILVVSNPLVVYFNLSFVVPIGSEVDSIKNSLNQTLTNALVSHAYANSLAIASPALFSAAATIGGPIFFGGVIIQTPATGTAQLAVNILTATFEHKIVPVYKNASSCVVVSYSDVVVLSVVLKVTNIGPVAYRVDPADLKKERCSSVVSNSAFYSLSAAGLMKTRSEKCISDYIAPLIYNCSYEGISSGNYFVSTQWMDVSAATLTAGTTYPVTVTVLPHNKLLTATSNPIQVTYIGSRRRALRALKAIPHGGLPSNVLSAGGSEVQ